jgi:hypothetical protein
VYGTGGVGVYGVSAADSPAVWGQNSNTTGQAADGVHGVASGAGSSGVAGVNTGGGVGVYGTGGVGVFGTGSNYGFQTDSNVQQARTASGWIKAMFFFSPYNGGGFVQCYNSTLSGAAATTPPCGFQFTLNTGDYLFDFGFQVDDRFLSVTAGTVLEDAATLATCTDLSACYGYVPTPNQVEVTNGTQSCGLINCSLNLTNNKIYLIVY